jgi:ferredoxin-NADP reductase
MMTATETDTATARRSAYRELEAELLVSAYEAVAADVVALTLSDPDGRDLPEWRPGAHIDLMLTPSLVRQYSLCGSAKDRSQWRVAVLLDPGGRGGSQLVHEELREGSRVRVRGPRNHFPLVSSPRYQFIAGGIGITPMLPMIAAAASGSADWHLLYGGRQRASMAFVDELSGYGDSVALWPQDERGLLDLQSVLGTPRDDTLVYCCGPEGLLSAVEAACEPWPQGSLHIERFAAKPPAAEAAPGALETFEVVCQQSGVTVTVEPDKSIFDAVEEAGVDVLASCMEGVCGTCECRIIEGSPDHRDSLLTEAEREAGEVMMICVSRSRSERLVLDI